MRPNSTGGTLTINNAGGLIRATGGSFNMRNGAYAITGGRFEIGAGGSVGQQRVTTFTDVTVSNSGTWTSSNALNTVAPSVTLAGTSSFTNTGTFNLINESNLTSVDRLAEFVVSSSASLTNNGVINITRNNATLTGKNHQAYLQMNASGFTNQGAINMTSYAGQEGIAQFRASQNFSNAGAITIDGPRSSIEMATRTFTQSAGSLSLVNGGTMTAGSVLINSGTLLGTGSINAPVTIGGILSPGSDSGGARAVVCVARPEPSLPLGRK